MKHGEDSDRWWMENVYRPIFRLAGGSARLRADLYDHREDACFRSERTLRAGGKPRLKNGPSTAIMSENMWKNPGERQFR
jgi:hypothetical protein